MVIRWIRSCMVLKDINEYFRLANDPTRLGNERDYCIGLIGNFVP